ncbi:MAG: oligopeptide transporter ATP-binding protein [Chloroflexi bacterium]|nr:oligopeptide transporter ATP-binding protein [Chloroflexota bacterium]
MSDGYRQGLVGHTPGNTAGPDSPSPVPLLQVQDLVKAFPRRVGLFDRRAVSPPRAVDGVSFDVARGETFGLVGESGCGKSTIARCVLHLLRPDSGQVRFDGTDIGQVSTKDLRRLRQRMQMVFQDPFTTLDSRMSAYDIVAEPLLIHGVRGKDERDDRVRQILSLVGLIEDQFNRRPHEFSGGQRQRIGLARALVLNPELVILDEPVSALDVSIQAQVLNLLRDLQQRLGLTYLFIVHDLTIAEYFCDRLAVLYLGAVMELADRETLFREPLHPYTDALLSAVPVPDRRRQRRRQRVIIKGEVVPLSGPQPGCRFRPRCPVGRDRETCANVEPPLREVSPGHWVACHFAGELRNTTVIA